MIKVGFDYFNTITKHPSVFSAISKIVSEMGGETYIISATRIDPEDPKMGKWYDAIFMYLINNEILVGSSGIKIFSFKEPEDIPIKKLKICKELGIKYFFDDNGNVVNLLSANGINAIIV